MVDSLHFVFITLATCQTVVGCGVGDWAPSGSLRLTFHITFTVPCDIPDSVQRVAPAAGSQHVASRCYTHTQSAAACE